MSMLKKMVRLSTAISRLENAASFDDLGRRFVYARLKFVSAADDVAGFLGTNVKYKLVTGDPNRRWKVTLLNGNGEALQASTARIKYLLRTGDLVEIARIFDSALTVSSKTAAAFKRAARSTAAGAFARRTKGIAEVNEMIRVTPEFVRTVTNEAEFLIQAKKAGLMSRVKAVGDALAKKVPLKGVIVTTAVGGTVYAYLSAYAREASGCYKITKTGGVLSKCKAVEYSTGATAAKTGCDEVHPPKGGAAEDLAAVEAGGPCSHLCDNDVLAISEDQADEIHYECVDMDVWDALGDVTTGIAKQVTTGVDKVLGSNVQTWKWVLIGGVTLVLVWSGSRYAIAFKRHKT